MKITKILNCVFTTEELKEIGVKLALENQRKERLEDEKKQSQSQFKSEIDAADARSRALRRSWRADRKTAKSNATFFSTRRKKAKRRSSAATPAKLSAPSP